MLWTYRVFQDQEGYCIRIVYYERDGKLMGYQHEPAQPTGETVEELLQDIEAFKQAFELPILTTDQLDAELEACPPKAHKVRTANRSLDDFLAERDRIQVS